VFRAEKAAASHRSKGRLEGVCRRALAPVKSRGRPYLFGRYGPNPSGWSSLEMEGRFQRSFLLAPSPSRRELQRADEHQDRGLLSDSRSVVQNMGRSDVQLGAVKEE